MKKTLIIALLLATVSFTYSQDIPVYEFEGFEQFLNQEGDSLYLVNFWATWCVPCVKEMPALNKLAINYSNTRLSILLVSLDMPRQIDSRVKPFIEKYNLQSKVILLDDPDFNSWIDKVHEDWGGAIPATLIYSKRHRAFYEQSFDYEELENIVQIKLNEL
jgi:thiol-disulfide isomerase/thioredoxin